MRDEENRQKRRFSIYVDEEDYHKIEETSSANGVSKNEVINDFLKTCLVIVDEVGEYIREKGLDTFLQLVNMKTTKHNVYRLHFLLSDLHLIKTVRDTIKEGGKKMSNGELYENVNYYVKVFMKARDKEMRELGTLLSDAHNRLVESDNLLAEAREQIKILAQAGISENTKPTELEEMVRKQNEILQEYVGLASVLAEKRGEREINESIDESFRVMCLKNRERGLRAYSYLGR